MTQQTQLPEPKTTVTMTATGGELRITEVRKSYGISRGVESVSIDVRPGEFLTMLGPSGSGKTTTLNLVAGFLDPDEGSITLDGKELSGVPPHLRGIGMVFQQYALFPHMSIEENVDYPLRVRKMPRADRAKLVGEALEMVQLTDYAKRKPSELSGGQQQRVALARAFVFKPRLLLMDEPLGALDKKLREAMQIEITRICRELGATVIYVTHDQEEALAMSDRIAIYNNGRIEQLGTAEDLYSRPKSLFVADFVGESTVIKGQYAKGKVAHQEGIFSTEGAFGSLPEDSAAAVVIRPEDLTVVPSAESSRLPASVNTLDATVTKCVYLGQAKKCLLRSDTGLVINARIPANAPSELFSPGDRAVVAWNAADSVLIPAG
jgi:putative spermidine/putrescine transport system ATP-binding protein